MVRIGTSGYVYPHWRDVLYRGVPQRRWLARYAEVFATVELNGTFYRLPAPESVDRWAAETPDGFVFACKGSRYVTHNKKLTDPEPGVDLFFSRIVRLGAKLGPVLWQLPPQLRRADLPRLERFLAALPREVRHAVEFRSPDWYTETVCDALEAAGAAFCEHDLVDRAAPRRTGGFRYLRFHGTRPRYGGRYGRAALAPVAEDLRRWRDAHGRDAYVYFNNDEQGHAVRDALDLLALLDPGRPGC